MKAKQSLELLFSNKYERKGENHIYIFLDI